MEIVIDELLCGIPPWVGVPLWYYQVLGAISLAISFGEVLRERTSAAGCVEQAELGCKGSEGDRTGGGKTGEADTAAGGTVAGNCAGTVDFGGGT